MKIRFNNLEKFTLQTTRLTLIPFQPEDVELFHQINTDPLVRKYLWDDTQIPLSTASDIIQQNTKHFTEDDFGLWKIYLTPAQQWVGYTGLWYFFDESLPQLLYALFPTFTGQGIATEAAQRILYYAFTQLKFPHVKAAMDTPNQASIKVALRLGMQHLETRVEQEQETLFFQINNTMLDQSA